MVVWVPEEPRGNRPLQAKTGTDQPSANRRLARWREGGHHTFNTAMPPIIPTVAAGGKRSTLYLRFSLPLRMDAAANNRTSDGALPARVRGGAWQEQTLVAFSHK